MKHLLKGRKPSPALVVAMFALCISLVGTAFADPIAEISGLGKKDKRTVRKISRNISNRVSDRKITQRAPGLAVASANLAALANAVADNTVGSAQLKDAGVTPDDLANAAVTLDKLADNSVNGSKVIDESLGAADLGPNSVSGSEIAASAVGGNELENFHAHLGTTVEITDPTGLDGDWISGTATASCTAGEQMVGYYAEWTSAGDENAVQEIIPNFGANSVTARGITDNGSTESFRAVAVCVFN